ncbi:MAG: multifunctional CCA addition/repair protein [Hahellaceae bacterium]|nr:multifunctional CCA addition/repair protein [Hahellaceae bacterium]MCP5168683.1 multifunctional CCA addition/repair protein [Hahellaceae bacterium]
MKTYLVGGAVRDQLLGIPVKDRDWVIVGATPQALIDAGFKQVGADFPVFLHPDSHEEYALARTERKTGHGYHGFSCYSAPDVTLEDDLIRRDLTINAMAMDMEGQLVDPYGGQADLEHRILRHVSSAFCEDPLRVLRVARFAARLAPLGFHVADATLDLMRQMNTTGELDHLVAERVWQETQRALTENAPEVFFEVLRQCGALATLFPELDRLFGIPQPEKHHPEVDTGVHSLLCLKQATLLSKSSQVRYAALIHDLGKGLSPVELLPSHHGHEQKGVAEVKSLCARLKAPAEYRTLAILACEFHTHIHRAFELKPSTLLKVLKACDVMRKPERFEQVILVCTADARGRTGFESAPYPQAAYVSAAAQAIRTVQVKTFVEQGLTGADIGKAIDAAQLQILTQHKLSWSEA